MPITFQTLEDRKKMAVHTLKERTYLDAQGKATTDESKAATLLGVEGDEITMEEAAAAGLVKEAPETPEAPEPVMLFYDAEGKRVAEGSPAVALQYLDSDPNRPDAPKAAEPTENDGLDAMKKADLEQLAADEGVDLSEAKNNKDRVAAIRAARG